MTLSMLLDEATVSDMMTAWPTTPALHTPPDDSRLPRIVNADLINGYLDTGMAFTNRTPLPKASPERLADIVARQGDADFGRRYYPSYWRPLCFVLRWLPWRVYRTLRF